jgi:hypothetical protein
MTLSEHPHPLVPVGDPRQLRWDPAVARLPACSPPSLQGALALTFPLVPGSPPDPAPPVLSLVSDLPSTRAVPVDPQEWASRFLQAVVEVVASERPLTQLARWTDPRVYAEIGRSRQRVAARRAASRTRAGRQHVASVHVSRPSPDVAEVSARVTTGPRSRAIAAQLTFSRERWLCTALDFG